MPFYLMSILGVRVISAAGRNQWLLAIAAANVTLNIIGNYVLMNIIGVAGIALATTMVVCLSWLTVRLLVSRMIDRNMADRHELAQAGPNQWS